MNPFGDEALAMLPEWWAKGACVVPCGEKKTDDGESRA